MPIINRHSIVALVLAAVVDIDLQTTIITITVVAITAAV